MAELVADRLTIMNVKGLHARASAKFAETAERFDARISVSRDGYSVSGDSIMGLLTLAACKGSTIDIRAEGPDAEEAVDALRTLVAAKFDEAE